MPIGFIAPIRKMIENTNEILKIKCYIGRYYYYYYNYYSHYQSIPLKRNKLGNLRRNQMILIMSHF